MNQIVQHVLISGKQGSGKTTLAKELARRIHHAKGARAHFVNFADRLYNMHDYCLGILKQAGIDRDLKKDGPLLQVLGTEWGRKTVDENIWVKLLQSDIRRLIELDNGAFSKMVFLTADCRFKNEFDEMPNALRVRLECSRETRKMRCEMWRPNDTHPSEIDLDNYAETKKFDLYFDTGSESTDHCATLIMAQLDKNNWLEKRG